MIYESQVLVQNLVRLSLRKMSNWQRFVRTHELIPWLEKEAATHDAIDESLQNNLFHYLIDDSVHFSKITCKDDVL